MHNAFFFRFQPPFGPSPEPLRLLTPMLCPNTRSNRQTKGNRYVVSFCCALSRRVRERVLAKVCSQAFVNCEDQCRAGPASQQCDAASTIKALETVSTEEGTTDAEEGLSSSVGANG